ncbi:MAG: hydroxyphenylacetyl-CoA thioesterase PaaI [Proteobacteria bacterium]|nr:hydroxyphenylacetyl-CoA thioesterase PaaI [Pseudomonadota bacterium]
MDEDTSLAEQCAKEMYSRDVAVIALGIVIDEVRTGFSRARMRVRADMLNGHAICHGGLVFTLADTAFAYACNTHGFVTVASGAGIEFLLPSHEDDELVAEAQEKFRGRRSGVYDITVRNQRGETVALFRGRSHQSNERIVSSRDAGSGAGS